MNRPIPGPPTAPGPLPLLQARLAGGVGPALGAAAPRARTSQVAHGAPRLRPLLAPLDKLTLDNGLLPDEVTTAIDAIATYLRDNRPTLLEVTLHAHLLPAAMAVTDADPVQVWLRCCWLVEAAWQATNSTSAPTRANPTTGGVTAPAAPFAADDLSLLRPAAARQRFLLLTEPLRHSPGPVGGWPVDDRYGLIPVGLVEDVFGTGAGHDVIGRCRQARWIWGRYLAGYQDHPLLATATGEQLEAELDTVAFRTESATAPLVLSWRAIIGEATPSVDDWAAAADLAERHLLPRFRILRVLRLCLHPRDTAPRWVTATAAAVATSASGAVALAAGGWFIPAAATSVACFLLLAAGVVVIGQAWAAAWLLRLPAAGALGLAALTTLHPDWWQDSRHWAPAALALIAASYGYLAVEARNHGVAPAQALGRALGVTAIGLVHALLVTLIGLVVIVPEYAENGTALSGLWDHHGVPYHQWPVSTGWAVLLSGTAWCLAAGVFSQVLWDDRPITAPLAHLRWRGDR